MIQRTCAPARGAVVLSFPVRTGQPAPEPFDEAYAHARQRVSDLVAELVPDEPTPFECELLSVLRRIDRRLSTLLKGV